MGNTTFKEDGTTPVIEIGESYKGEIPPNVIKLAETIIDTLCADENVKKSTWHNTCRLMNKNIAKNDNTRSHYYLLTFSFSCAYPYATVIQRNTAGDYNPFYCPPNQDKQKEYFEKLLGRKLDRCCIGQMNDDYLFMLELTDDPEDILFRLQAKDEIIKNMKETIREITEQKDKKIAELKNQIYWIAGEGHDQTKQHFSTLNFNGI